MVIKGPCKRRGKPYHLEIPNFKVLECGKYVVEDLSHASLKVWFEAKVY